MSGKSDPVFHLPHRVFDTHFHGLHLAEKGLDVRDILREAFGTGLDGAVEVAVDEASFNERKALVEEFPGMKLACGIHPSSVSEDIEARFREISRQAGHPLVVAIGETGLDSYRDYTPAELQEESFRLHLELSAEMDKPVIIHNRKADARVLAIVRESECRNGVFHCFSSGRETAEAALELGFHISFAGNLTYKNNHELQELSAWIPEDRLLIETDSPYLSPLPRRGRPNHPGHLGYTLEFLALCRGIAPGELSGRIVDNSKKLFGMS